ncbi:MAG TPA: GNAT family N-acetyltransferase [Thermoleophilaceae bacterium]|nr:GNAT family N-acetyltransferase [Thermoleophilaceae bacterium]
MSVSPVALRRGTPADVDRVAEIWALATSTRDAIDPAPLEVSRERIDEALAEPGSFVLVAERAGDVIAFALVHRERGAGERAAELRFLATDPAQWSAGAATELLEALPGVLREAGYERVCLTVYAPNPRARSLYEHMGWARDGTPPRSSKRTGKLKLRYRLSL